MAKYDALVCVLCVEYMFKGMVEVELELLTLEEVELLPAGKGRDEPNMNPFLPEPK